MTHKQCVIFVEQPRVCRQSIVEEALVVSVVDGIVVQAGALQNPTGVCVNDEEGFTCGVEENVVRRLLADAVDGQQVATQGGVVCVQHCINVAVVDLPEMVE